MENYLENWPIMDKQTTKGVSTPSKSSAKSGNCESSDGTIFVFGCEITTGTTAVEILYSQLVVGFSYYLKLSIRWDKTFIRIVKNVSE